MVRPRQNIKIYELSLQDILDKFGIKGELVSAGIPTNQGKVNKDSSIVLKVDK